MTQAQINTAVAKASAKSFQRTSSLVRKFGLAAAHEALEAVAQTYPGRVRVYGKEAGGIGPGR